MQAHTQSRTPQPHTSVLYYSRITSVSTSVSTRRPTNRPASMQPRNPRLQLSALFLQRLTALLETILSSGGDGCILVVVRSGRIRRLQLRLDHDLPPAADLFIAPGPAGRTTTE